MKPGGASIAVTEENKREYVKLYVNYRFMRGIEQQFLALQKGKTMPIIFLQYAQNEYKRLFESKVSVN